ncbi:regulator of G-protein signaling 7 isoform 1 [Planoprotostelium fungivorum]|uniref:Regulator of G-protein signaling 7 isoform 1 n=1 Tax=Planoprotostelium fungivorum TaxID=1890364 RepID=A0A2P6N105_9EUKA|nr:regulator of G-protein signaling 7 isoform 1 [Planoprotostelium fungivorum]
MWAPSVDRDRTERSQDSDIPSNPYDVGLETILSDEDLVMLLREFMKGNFSSENLAFLIEVEAFKAKFLGCSPDDAKLKNRAAEIYLKYIVDSSSGYELNISGALVNEIKNTIGHPYAAIFNRAQASVFRLVEMDCYPKFIRHPPYMEFIDARIQASTSPKRSWRNSIMQTRSANHVGEMQTSSSATQINRHGSVDDIFVSTRKQRPSSTDDSRSRATSIPSKEFKPPTTSAEEDTSPTKKKRNSWFKRKDTTRPASVKHISKRSSVNMTNARRDRSSTVADLGELFRQVSTREETLQRYQQVAHTQSDR